ncbi:septum formation protein Maf [Achromobacter sp. GG226]|uniref:Maf family nucleotide pyrophosphatase n=1 Tax=Verticiella alkaliphila TaxID=2779529 RepID=UPI001C0C131A|nr:Maf family nucleotide pyrophosphatase [Verticiella sp. GG226]MBU4612927.1 septum formation protein Maf [Verticiella sp. GG226]
MPTDRPRLILASTSVYRKQLLERLRLPFDTQAPGVDETALPGETPADLALRLAQAKAHAIAVNAPGAVVIGSDQVAVCAGEALGKPGDFDHAFAQLRRMAGQDVAFHSALAVTDGTRTEVADVITHCRLRPLTDAQLIAYLKAETPYDTAGSAKAEALGIALMERIDSDDPTALIGLPLIALTRMLASFGLDPLDGGAA